MPEKLNLTKTMIEALPFPTDKERVHHYDDRICRPSICLIKGLRLVRLPLGDRSAAASANTRGKRLSRRRAEEVNAVLAQSDDLGEPLRRRQTELTFDEVFE